MSHPPAVQHTGDVPDPFRQHLEVRGHRSGVGEAAGPEQGETDEAEDGRFRPDLARLSQLLGGFETGFGAFGQAHPGEAVHRQSGQAAAPQHRIAQAVGDAESLTQEPVGHFVGSLSETEKGPLLGQQTRPHRAGPVPEQVQPPLRHRHRFVEA